MARSIAEINKDFDKYFEDVDKRDRKYFARVAKDQDRFDELMLELDELMLELDDA